MSATNVISEIIITQVFNLSWQLWSPGENRTCEMHNTVSQQNVTLVYYDLTRSIWNALDADFTHNVADAIAQSCHLHFLPSYSAYIWLSISIWFLLFARCTSHAISHLVHYIKHCATALLANTCTDISDQAGETDTIWVFNITANIEFGFMYFE